MSSARTPAARAWAYVAARSAGQPVDPGWRVTLNFHPDRMFRGRPLLAVMADDGVYRSQFETGTSNGGLTAYPGGDRWHWESRIFGQAYDTTSPSERPCYGALNLGHAPAGAAPRFGSAHLRLASGVLARTTFCYPDSVYEPSHFGVFDRFALVELLAAAARHVDPLDLYIEAHVHGGVLIARDVEAIVLDPSFRHTEIEALAHALPCRVEWHAGFRAGADLLRRQQEYRGPAVAELAAILAGAHLLTPVRIGEALHLGQHDPQMLKQVWHCLARFGNCKPR
ncbi:DUF3626 domain-containing protein [Ralstonia sp. 25mfcol4.1]|uniref:DUF3626 domain-containing protein n=1 Tax=Ralstonia sp. 25mfcol4.1 TaxID=1761899 RepID=UPI0004910C01|nr:DUF3626 domain-containing protein [Ralstonia sp. 25mfcol4.1]